MKKRIGILVLFLLTACLTGGCTMRTVDQMYCVPRRSQSFSHVQKAMDMAMIGLEYAAPVSGENQQTVQLADLDGDGTDEYLLFARSPSKSPLEILVFDTDEEGGCYLLDVIQLQGSAFEKVEYENIDQAPGLEIVVGCQVSDQLMGNVSVYSFLSGRSERLMRVNYLHFLTCDLDQNQKSELLVLTPEDAGQSSEGRTLAISYQYDNSMMERYIEVPLSASGDSVKRIMEGRLEDGAPAVFVSSTVGDSAIATDVLIIRDEKLLNLSGSGEEVSALRSYYVYANDIDGDGVTELPRLIPMEPVTVTPTGDSQFLVHWYSLDSRGKAYDKRDTFHNYGAGWYFQLDPGWARRISVEKQGADYVFYLWDEEKTRAEALFTLFTLTGSNRDQEAVKNGRFPLYRKEGIAYAAELHKAAQIRGVTEEYLKNSFHLIHQAWKTGET